MDTLATPPTPENALPPTGADGGDGGDKESRVLLRILDHFNTQQYKGSLGMKAEFSGIDNLKRILAAASNPALGTARLLHKYGNTSAACYRLTDYGHMAREMLRQQVAALN